MKSLRLNIKTGTVTYGGKSLYKDEGGFYTVGKYKMKDYIREDTEVKRIQNIIR